MNEYKLQVPPDQARVLITGATSGVGEATARFFANRGASLALFGRRRSDLQSLVAELGKRTHFFVVDVSDAQAVVSAVHTAIETLGGLDVAVNAAGVAGPVLLGDLNEALWNEAIATNLSGTFYVSRAAGLHMRSAGSGSIVNVASDLAFKGNVGYAHYCASKAGVLGLSRALALELAPEVRVNSICPGPIDTKMLRAGFNNPEEPGHELAEKAATVPLNRIAKADEVARAIYFLALEGTFATGTSMAFDGGTSIT